MISSMAPSILWFLILLTISKTSSSRLPDPTPAPWPEQFHSTLIAENGDRTLREIIELWYDWPNGISMSIGQRQLGQLLYGPEWNNGTSFTFTLDSSKECRVTQFSVGIVRPNWVQGAKYIGQQYMDGFLCNVWNKVEFMLYYEDVVSKRPVAWTFLEGGGIEHVMTFEVGKVLDHSYWQAPVYCFDDATELKKKEMDKQSSGGALESSSVNGMSAHLITFEVGKVLDDPNWQAPVYCFNNAAEQEKPNVDKRTGIAIESVASTDGPYHGSLMRSVAMNLTAAL